jgi:uncharacterized protein Yka (UPF0111/DUF47 family)
MNYDEIKIMKYINNIYRIIKEQEKKINDLESEIDKLREKLKLVKNE